MINAGLVVVTNGKSFKIKRWSNFAEVANVHETDAREAGDVRDVWVRNDVMIVHRPVGDERER